MGEERERFEPDERGRLEPEGGREKQHPDVEGHKQHPVSTEAEAEEEEESGADVIAHKQHPTITP